MKDYTKMSDLEINKAVEIAQSSEFKETLNKDELEGCMAILYADQRIKELEQQLNRAIRALERAGFEDLGGQEWKPPLGKAPKFIETAPGWISVNEKLPEENEIVLVYDNKVALSIAGRYCGDGFWRSQEGWVNESVTHWQPLPEPPKSEGE